MFKWIHKFGSSPWVYGVAGRLAPWLGWACVLLLGAGLYQGLVVAPPDYEQGETYRIMYVHVPSAWLSMFIYMVMAMSSAIFLVWRIKVADIIALASAPIGVAFTAAALVTGSFWGRPTWGTWWEWDARLTSELLLLFIYLGYLALRNAYENPQSAARAAAVLAIVGAVNIPVIHFSVEWWNSLHQPATITKIDTPSIHISMLIPLLLMVLAFQLLYFHHLCVRLQTLLLERESRAGWVARLAAADA
ncbi:MAG: heme ABC transporter permease [Gammaproteobacteria bacterium]|nr:MAG: heme ABC transporter permease [Gammaproteobacteria bacterium]PIE36281.1 MAG: heme ABC transporter permease [Gammaproteobacteria bacterium]